MFKRIRAYYSQEATSRRDVEREWRNQREVPGSTGSRQVDEIKAIYFRPLEPLITKGTPAGTSSRGALVSCPPTIQW